MIKLVECPRDAMQGIHEWISTEKKVDYINSLLRVGFDTLDFGSFVSSKAIPQMADTAEVLERLDLKLTNTKLLAIVANKRGALEASAHSAIHYLGYPFSISETFSQRNTNASISESLERVKEIQEICIQHKKQLVIYVSMGFGNPYNEAWNVEIVENWVEKLAALQIYIISLSDTVGVSNPENIAYLFKNLIPRFPNIEFGAHLHTHPHNWQEKLEAAWMNGCKRFDGAIKGYGGCPMANDDLVGNMPMEHMIAYFHGKNINLGIHHNAFETSYRMASYVFPNT